MKPGRKCFGNKAYWLKSYFPPRSELRATEIDTLRCQRWYVERILANPPTRRAYTAALLDWAWIRQALRDRGDYGCKGRKQIGSRCPIRIG